MFLVPSSSRAVDPYLQTLLLRVSLSRLGGKHRQLLTLTLIYLVVLCWTLFLPFKRLGCRGTLPLKWISSWDWIINGGRDEGTWGRTKKTRKMSFEITFILPSGFFFSVMTPLNFIHLDHLSTSTSFFLIQNYERMFNIRKVRFHTNFLLFNYLHRNPDTLLKLRYTKYIVDSGELRRKSHSISHCPHSSMTS